MKKIPSIHQPIQKSDGSMEYVWYLFLQWVSENAGKTDLSNYFTKEETEELLAPKVDADDLASVAFTGDYSDLTNKPSIPAPQVNSDWNAVSGVTQILNKPSLATVATSGSYNDLSNKPTIPTVNNATLTIQKNGATVNTFTANASSDVTVNIAVPTNTNELTNGAGFITGINSSDVTTALGYTPANISLSNLNSTGKNLGNWSTNVTNCITEIPQDINISINASNQLELVSGSTVYLGNSTAVPISTTIKQTSTTLYTGKFLVATNPAGTSFEVAGFSSAVSAASNPGTAYIMWFNTTDGKPYINGSDGTAREISFPIAIASFTNGTGWASVDQVFNGFGYIGSTVFALPGTKGLYPNGRNTDGTLKSGNLNTTSVKTYTVTSTSVKAIQFGGGGSLWGYQGYFASDVKPSVNYSLWYNPTENILYDTGAGTPSPLNTTVCAFVEYDGTKITSFNTKTAFHAVDYGDFADTIANINDKFMGAPDWNNVTQVSTDTYTALTNGYFMAWQSGSNNMNLAVFVNQTNTSYTDYGYRRAGGANTSHAGGVAATVPVAKGDVITVTHGASWKALFIACKNI